MAEVDSDEEGRMREEESESKKPVYTRATRDVSDRPVGSKKLKVTGEADQPGELNPDEIEYEDDEEYYQKLMTSKESEKEDEMDMLKMQLELEKEEAERKLKAGKPTETKTRVDEDGTEYEWDPVVKGWFPKV